MTSNLPTPPADGTVVESTTPVRMPHHPEGSATAIRRGVVYDVYDAREQNGDDFYIIYWTPTGSLQMIGSVVSAQSPRPLRVLDASENGQA